MNRRYAGLFFIPVLLCLLVLPAQAAPFSYSAQNEAMPEFLCAYSASQSKSCSVSAKISGSITGNLEFRTPDAFFSFLENSRDIITYQDSSTIYYYDRSEMESATLPLNRISVSKISAALREMQALDPRYPLRAINNGRMLRLQAPPVYVSLVTSLISDMEGSFAAAKGTRVFRLKHAWADDIELNFMDKTTVVPGVATLLRRITNDGANAPAAMDGEGASMAPGRLKGSGMASRTGTQEASRMEQQRRRDQQAMERTAQNAGARILADSRLNAVIIWDDEELLPFYERLIQELDQPVILVEIRAAIVDVSVERLKELGVAWSAQAAPGQGSHWGAVGGANVGVGSTATNFASQRGYGLNLTTIYRDGLDVFMARVHALEEDGDASVLSRPAVLTLDNIQASMEATNTYYIEVAGQEEVDLFDVTYGTILRVTPHVIRDEYSGRSSIKLTVHVEDGGSRADASNANIKYPVISRTMVNTQALVGENQALVIGGHYYETVISGESGIPLLKDIPLLGALFKTQTDSYSKQERLFIISPRLVTPETLNTQTAQYGEMFQRTMMTQPVTRVERTTGGCARQRRVSAQPLPMPMPAAQGPQMNAPEQNANPIPGQVTPQARQPSAPVLTVPQSGGARL